MAGPPATRFGKGCAGVVFREGDLPINRPARALIAAMTWAADGFDHLVAAESHAAGVAPGTGDYAALCGHRVVAAPLIGPPGPPCPRCAIYPHRAPLGRGRHRARVGGR